MSSLTLKIMCCTWKSHHNQIIKMFHCVKGVRIWSFSGPHFPIFGLNTERYTVLYSVLLRIYLFTVKKKVLHNFRKNYLRIQSECGKIQTRKTPYIDTFYAVLLVLTLLYFCSMAWPEVLLSEVSFL